jgi:hypothetical protein
MKDHLLGQGTTSPADVGRPADAHPSMLSHATFPGVPLVEEGVLVTGSAATHDFFELADEIRRQPIRDLASKVFVFFGKSGVHEQASAKHRFTCAPPGALSERDGHCKMEIGEILRYDTTRMQGQERKALDHLFDHPAPQS